MPRTHGRVQVTIWADEDFRALTSSAQRVYLMLISQPQFNNCGVLPYVPRKWAKLAPDTTTESMLEALNELDAERFVVVDEDTQELLVRSFVKHDRIEAQPNMKLSAQRQFPEIESQAIKNVLRDEYPDLFGWRDRQKPLFSEETEPLSEGVTEPLDEPLHEGVSARARPRSRDHTPAPPAPTPTPRETEPKAEENSATGSLNGPVASERDKLPVEKERLAMQLKAAAPVSDDGAKKIDSLCAELPEGALAKVLESTLAKKQREEVGPGYVIKALRSELAERSAA